jgi:hypothetical protein
VADLAGGGDLVAALDGDLVDDRVDGNRTDAGLGAAHVGSSCEGAAVHGGSGAGDGGNECGREERGAEQRGQVGTKGADWHGEGLQGRHELAFPEPTRRPCARR